MTEQSAQFVHQVKSGPGRILRAAREEAGMSTQDVAAELHLRASIVEALEREDYTEFSSDVFLKGYFRSYCRLVNLHETRMVELLVAQLENAQDGESSRDESAAAGILGGPKSGSKLGMFASLLLITGLVFAVYFFLQTSDESAPSEPVVIESLPDETVYSEAESNVGIDASSNNPAASEEKPAIDGSDEDSTEEGSSEENISAEASSEQARAGENAATAAESNLTENVSVEQSAGSETRTSFIADPLNTGELETTPAQEDTGQEITNTEAGLADSESLAAGSTRFTANFTGDCWFKVVDGGGKTVIADLKRDGDIVNFEGLAPFKFVLGDATVVSLEYEGESVDLSPHTSRNKRAEFTLGE